jgi:hypothetical protein
MAPIQTAISIFLLRYSKITTDRLFAPPGTWAWGGYHCTREAATMKVRIRRRSALALFTALLVVLAISIVSDARMENESIRYAIAVSSQYRIAVYHLGREPEPQWLEVGFGLQWVSRDGFWVGGLRAKDYQDLINFTPRTLYVQNLQTGEKRTYAAVAREVERFAFTDDLRYLAVLGVPHDLENPQEPTSLFLFDMAEPQPQRRYVRRGAERCFCIRSVLHTGWPPPRICGAGGDFRIRHAVWPIQVDRSWHRTGHVALRVTPQLRRLRLSGRCAGICKQANDT